MQSLHSWTKLSNDREIKNFLKLETLEKLRSQVFDFGLRSRSLTLAKLGYNQVKNFAVLALFALIAVCSNEIINDFHRNI